MASILINGVVAVRDGLPYIQISNEDGIVAQLSMAEARNVAMDIMQMCARTEADAMLRRFFDINQYPEDAWIALIIAFRDFRDQLDREQIETFRENPDTGEVH